MDTNPYAAPVSEVVAEPGAFAQKFYVVAPVKFFLLFISTLGVYQLYWHYKNWALFKKARRGDEWPIARAIFAIFFTHYLFREIDKELTTNRSKHSWKPELCATVIVLLLIADRIISRVSEMSEDFTILDAFSLMAIPVICYFYYKAQKAANAACGDPDGLTNANYSIANIIWIVLGGLFLLLIFASLALIALTDA